MELAAAALATAALVFTATALLVARRELRALLPLRPEGLRGPLLVVIPARNEPDIAACVRAVLADPSPLLRVVVVDDRSSDDTAARARAVDDARLRVLSIDDEPPPGVFGKPRALERGAALAGAGEPLLFLDADVLLAPGALGALERARETSGAAAVSGLPRVVTRGVVEQLLVPTFISVVTARHLVTAVHDDARADDAFLNGQLILIDQDAYRAAGGFAAVEGTVLEDVALARRLKAQHRRLRLVDARALASTRMYSSLPAILRGFGKNARALLGNSAGALGVVALALSSAPWLALGLSPSWPIAAVVVVNAGLQVAARTLARAPRWPVLVLPIAYLVVAAVLVRASLGSTVEWKGRRYRV